MRTWTVAVAIALTAMTSACGGDEPQPEASAPPVDSTRSGEAQLLTGTVGTEEDPDAFEITLVDSSGEAVEQVPAGDYTIVVDDLSEIHNFHLEGEDVDETTTVPEVGQVSWEVTLTEGEYTAICDPHPGMRLEFTVT